MPRLTADLRRFCDNGRIVSESLAIISRHPRLPAVELHRGPGSGVCYLLAVGVQLSDEELVDVGEWLAEHGREHPAPPER